jgi:hypothetical protein
MRFFLLFQSPDHAGHGCGNGLALHPFRKQTRTIGFAEATTASKATRHLDDGCSGEPTPGSTSTAADQKASVAPGGYRLGAAIENACHLTSGHPLRTDSPEQMDFTR